VQHLAVHARVGRDAGGLGAAEDDPALDLGARLYAELFTAHVDVPRDSPAQPRAARKDLEIAADAAIDVRTAGSDRHAASDGRVGAEPDLTARESRVSSDLAVELHPSARGVEVRTKRPSKLQLMADGDPLAVDGRIDDDGAADEQSVADSLFIEAHVGSTHECVLSEIGGGLWLSSRLGGRQRAGDEAERSETGMGRHRRRTPVGGSKGSGGSHVYLQVLSGSRGRGTHSTSRAACSTST